MTKHLFPFVASFMVGCAVALAIRSAGHRPHEGGAEQSTTPGYAQMVTNPVSPGGGPTAQPAMLRTPDATPAAAPAAATPALDPHANHPGASIMEPHTVNTVCAICGMDVDPTIEPATYQGKLVGFGCRMCPPKFAREPDLYGPAALENRVVAN